MRNIKYAQYKVCIIESMHNLKYALYKVCII